ncbi:MAG: iron ABC transporter permease [Planctomycetes bacterium]|nr:iron ABC transporter permease [Planctomycetota bacterium]MCP4772048.1 iron ABC transporter permease [Planctomycetota bacterium]MCP4860308.1 iron ABC transporter permease [Planctomycetota bacterium]
MTPRPRLLLLWLTAFSLGCGFLAPFLGTEPIAIGTATLEWLSGDRSSWSTDTRILDLRLPRVLLAWLSGGALAVAGAAMQTLLRNSLATPYTLGVSTAGTFGAFLCLAFPSVAGLLILPRFAALLFALAATFLVLSVARRSHRSDGIILAGVTLNFLFGAALMMVRYLADPYKLAVLDRWLMGSLDVVGFDTPLSLLPWLAIGLVLLMRRTDALDQFAFDPEMAAARGIQAKTIRRDGLLAASLLAAAVVAYTGPIGFIGLLVPHALRGYTGMRHALLLPACWLAGSGFLVIADLCARSLEIGGRHSEMPVGILTALVGGPFFLWVLMRER